VIGAGEPLEARDFLLDRGELAVVSPQQGGTMRALVTTVVVVCVASAASALDITTCGQVVPGGETGVQQVDLDCSDQPVGTYGVSVERSGTLDLNGHTLVGPPLQPNGQLGFAVFCPLAPGCDPATPGCRGRGKCTVTSSVGLGSVTQGGIVSGHDLVATHLSIVGGFLAADGGRLVATDVALSGGGIVAKNVRVTDVTVDGAPEHGVRALKRVAGQSLTVTNCGGAGVAAERVSLDDLTATGNGTADYDGGGVFAGSCSLRNSMVTGNVISEDGWLYPVDLFTARRPRLEATDCDRSAVQSGAAVPTETWNVCSLD
jgi:hypothetical protein